jgi:hypothetical protein
MGLWVHLEIVMSDEISQNCYAFVTHISTMILITDPIIQSETCFVSTAAVYFLEH